MPSANHPYTWQSHFTAPAYRGVAPGTIFVGRCSRAVASVVPWVGRRGGVGQAFLVFSLA